MKLEPKNRKRMKEPILFVISRHLNYMEMGPFWKILLTSVLIFYVFCMIIKLIFRRKMRKLQQQYEQYTEGKNEYQYDNSKTPHVDPKIGEYTDFEEVE